MKPVYYNYKYFDKLNNFFRYVFGEVCFCKKLNRYIFCTADTEIMLGSHFKINLNGSISFENSDYPNLLPVIVNTELIPFAYNRREKRVLSNSRYIN